MRYKTYIKYAFNTEQTKRMSSNPSFAKASKINAHNEKTMSNGIRMRFDQSTAHTRGDPFMNTALHIIAHDSKKGATVSTDVTIPAKNAKPEWIK